MVPGNDEYNPRRLATSGFPPMGRASAFELDLLHRRRRDLELELSNVEMLERESRLRRSNELQLMRSISGEGRMEQLCASSRRVFDSPRSVSHFDSRICSSTIAIDSLARRTSRPMASLGGQVDDPGQLLKRLQMGIDLSVMKLQKQLQRIPPSDSGLERRRPDMTVSSRRSTAMISSFPKYPRHDPRRRAVNGYRFPRSDNACFSATWDAKKESCQMLRPGERKVPQPELPQPGGEQLVFPMSHPSDCRVLTKYQILIRQSLEFFQAMPSDLYSNVRGRSKRVKVGQFGVRCIYCNHKPIHRRERCSLAFPSHLWGVYQAAQSVAKNHLIGSCTAVPEAVRSDLCRLRGNASAKTGGGKKHWENSCREAGLYQDGDEPGIWLQRRFCRVAEQTTSSQFT